MTYQFLTVRMFQAIDSNGFIDQTMFKTKDKYGFDSLIFSKEVIDIVNGYVKCIRPRLNPSCDYLLISRNGTQIARLGEIFGRMVFQAIEKYVHPTRYRQIVETESAEKLSIEEQNFLSEDQKHTSNVAKVHYKKCHSRFIAEKGKEAMDKLTNAEMSVSKLKDIGKATESIHLQISVNNEKKSSQKSTQRKSKVAFSKEEDGFLLAGLKKYGKGKWTAILHDSTYKFNSTRTTSTLLTRAKVCKFI